MTVAISFPCSSLSKLSQMNHFLQPPLQPLFSTAVFVPNSAAVFYWQGGCLVTAAVFLGENCRSCGIFLAASFNVVACPGAILIIACFLLLPFMSDKFKLG